MIGNRTTAFKGKKTTIKQIETGQIDKYDVLKEAAGDKARALEIIQNRKAVNGIPGTASIDRWLRRRKHYKNRRKETMFEKHTEPIVLSAVIAVVFFLFIIFVGCPIYIFYFK